jgi:membrane-associated phospholipid phosphatase
MPQIHDIQQQQAPLRTRWFWVPFISALVLGAVSAYGGLNITGFRVLNTWGARMPGALWANVTLFGDALVIAVLFVPCLYRRTDVLTALLMSAAITTPCVHILKPMLGIPRPPGVFSVEMITVIGPAYRHEAFPSGHTAAAVAAAAVIVFSFRHSALRIGAVCAACAVGLSRIFVGVHWPMDVAAGWAVGWLGGGCAVALAQRISPRIGHTRIVRVFYGAVLLSAAVVLLTGYDVRYDQARITAKLVAGGALGTAVALVILGIREKVRSRGEAPHTPVHRVHE